LNANDESGSHGGRSSFSPEPCGDFGKYLRSGMPESVLERPDGTIAAQHRHTSAWKRRAAGKYMAGIYFSVALKLIFVTVGGVARVDLYSSSWSL